MFKLELQNKKKKIMKNTLIFAIASSLMIGGFACAKYITSISGQGPLTTAKWDVSYLKSALLRDGYDSKTIVVDKIAPGTEGMFTLTVKPAKTEVGFDYVTEITKLENKPTNLYFVVDKDGVAGTEKITTAERLGEVLSGHVNASSENKNDIKYVIHWKWDYETEISPDKNGAKTITDNDSIDTKDGRNAKTMVIQYTTTSTQVRPNKTSELYPSEIEDENQVYDDGDYNTTTDENTI